MIQVTGSGIARRVKDGQTPYLHIRYSDDGGLTFTANNGKTVGKYIGQYTDFIPADSSSVSSYTWALIKGENGAAAVSIKISGQQVYRYPSGATVPENTDIVLTAALQNSTGYNWGKMVNGSFVPYNITTSSVNFIYTALGTNNSLTIRCYTANNTVYDDFTLYKLFDGSNAINVILTNESHMVACDSEGVAKSGELGSDGKAITKVLVYKGSTLLTYGSDKDWTFGTMVDSNVTHDNASDSVYIKTITADSGYVDIPIVVGSTTITKRFSLTKSKDGQSGTSPITAILTNDSASVPCSSDGTVISYASAYGYIKVYDGIVDKTSECTDFTVSGTNCSGTINSTTDKGRYDLTSLTADAARLVISCKYGTTSVSKVFSVTKSKAGINGVSSVIYSIVASAYSLVKSITNVFTPSSISFTFYKTTGATKEAYSGYSKRFYSTDGSTFTALDASAILGGSASITPQSNYKAVKCVLYSDSSCTTILDSQTALVVSDGQTGGTGKAGLTFRETEWAAGVYFRNDIDLDTSPRYLDIVIVYNSSGGLTTTLGVKFDMYEAKAAHNGIVSSADNKPGSGANWGTYWQQVNQMLPIYTPLLLARLIKSSEIDVDTLVAKLLKTANSGPRVEIFGSMLNVYGNFATPNIRFGVNANGQAVLTYYDNNGNKIYDLGPKGFDWGSIVPSSWSTLRLTKICDVIANDAIPSWYNVTSQALTSFKNVTAYTGSDYYQYYAGSNPSLTEADRANEKYLFVSESVGSSKIPDGWYAYSTSGEQYLQYMSSGTNNYIKPEDPAIYENSAGVIDHDPIYTYILYEYVGGVQTRQISVFWNGNIVY